MKAMILAAGQGVRLRPLTGRTPKCMLPVGGVPLLEHTIRWLGQHGITELVINLCYLPQVVIDHFHDGSDWGVHITYSIEQQPLGTAGGVKNVQRFFDEPFIVWYGDNLSRCDLHRLVRFHRARRALATMALHYREDVMQSGIVGLDEDDRIVRFVEKPQPGQVFSHWVNAGILFLEPAVLDFIPPAPYTPSPLADATPTPSPLADATPTPSPLADAIPTPFPLADATPTPPLLAGGVRGGGGAIDLSHDVFPALLAAGQPLYGYRLSADEGLWYVDRPEDLARVQSEWEKAP